jgi:hypothetical protein
VSESRQGRKIILSCKPPRPAPEPTQSRIHYISGSFPGPNRSGRDAYHSSPPKAGKKNGWSYSSTPPICHHDVIKDSLPLSLPACILYQSTALITIPQGRFKCKFELTLFQATVSNDCFKAPPIASYSIATFNTSKKSLSLSLSLSHTHKMSWMSHIVLKQALFPYSRTSGPQWVEAKTG